MKTTPKYNPHFKLRANGTKLLHDHEPNEPEPEIIAAFEKWFTEDPVTPCDPYAETVIQ